jgi:UPF0271 protein
LIEVTLEMARGLQIGAHPGYPDRLHFGRVALDMTRRALVESLMGQLEVLGNCVARVGAGKVRHVKPHGALYNVAAKDVGVAEAVCEACVLWDPSVKLVGLAGGRLLEVGRRFGLQVLTEGFADRVYETDGSLRPRSEAGAVIEDPDVAAAQAVSLVRRVDTICVHGDSPGAVRIAAAVRAGLEAVSRMEL